MSKRTIRVRTEIPAALDNAANAVIRVGEGRGFVVEADDERRYVISAAHCLPTFPPATAASHIWERTYPDLLGPLGGSAEISAECLFCDPIADIAVLGEPDGQAYYDQSEAYQQLVDSAMVLPMTDLMAVPIGSLRKTRDRVWILDRDGAGWQPCYAETLKEGRIWLVEANSGIKGGMSGSPILAENGAAVGIIGLSSSCGEGDIHTERGPQARLVRDLPAWLLRAVQAR